MLQKAYKKLMSCFAVACCEMHKKFIIPYLWLGVEKITQNDLQADRKAKYKCWNSKNAKGNNNNSKEQKLGTYIHTYICMYICTTFLYVILQVHMYEFVLLTRLHTFNTASYNLHLNMHINTFICIYVSTYRSCLVRAYNK